MLGLNRNQWLGVSIIVIGALLVSKDSLATLFNADIANKIVAGCAILNLIVGGVFTLITGQTGMANQLANLKGVDVNISKDADPSLAKLAMDPTSNVSITPGQEQAVAKVAATQ